MPAGRGSLSAGMYPLTLILFIIRKAGLRLRAGHKEKGP